MKRLRALYARIVDAHEFRCYYDDGSFTTTLPFYEAKVMQKLYGGRVEFVGARRS